MGQCWYDSPYQLEEVAGTTSAHGLQLSSLHSQTRPASAPPSRAGPSSRKATPLPSPAVTPAAPLPDPIPPPPVVELPVPPQTETRQTRSSPRQQVVVEPSAKAKGKQRAVDPDPPFVVEIPAPAPHRAELMAPTLSADVSLVSDSAASSPLSSAAASPEANREVEADWQRRGTDEALHRFEELAEARQHLADSFVRMLIIRVARAE